MSYLSFKQYFHLRERKPSKFFSMNSQSEFLLKCMYNFSFSPLKLQAAEAHVQKLEKKLAKVIQKSQPYFEQKEVFNKALKSQKSRVQETQVGALKKLC